MMLCTSCRLARWDHICVRCRSVFPEGKWSKCQKEFEKLKEAERQEFGEGPAAAARACRAALPIL